MDATLRAYAHYGGEIGEIASWGDWNEITVEAA